MQLTPRYDGPPIVDLGPIGADPAAPMLRQRARLGALLEDLSPDEWAHATRCEGWSVRDVIVHLNSTNQFWAISIGAALAGEPTRFLASFDPVTSPAELVAASRDVSPEDVCDRYRSTCADLAAAVAAVGDDQWSVLGEAPPGHVSLRAVVAHALWDSWIHERDIALPLGRPSAEEPDEVAAVLRYASVLGPAFLAMVDDGRGGTIAVDAADPDVQLTIELGPTVSVRDGLPPGQAAVRLAGPAVALVEGLSFRAPLDADVAPERRWMLEGLGAVFDRPSQ